MKPLNRASKVKLKSMTPPTRDMTINPADRSSTTLFPQDDPAACRLSNTGNLCTAHPRTVPLPAGVQTKEAGGMKASRSRTCSSCSAVQLEGVCLQRQHILPQLDKGYVTSGVTRSVFCTKSQCSQMDEMEKNCQSLQLICKLSDSKPIT